MRTAAVLIVGLLIITPSESSGQWISNGLPICAAQGDETGLQIVPDQNGGVFAAWLHVVEPELWIQRNTGLTNVDVRAIATNSKGHVFLGTWGGGILRDTDNGKHWTQITTYPGDYCVSVLRIDTSDRIYVLDGIGMIYRSTDSGGNWTWLSGGLPADIFPSGMVVDSEGWLYLSTDGNGVFRSRDQGSTWEAFNSNLATSGISCIAVSNNGYYLYAGTNGNGIYRYSYGNPGWTQVNQGLLDMTIVTIECYYGTSVMAATAGEGIFYSDDTGATWASRSTGLDNLNITSLQYVQFGKWLAGSNGGGIFYTEDYGLHWRGMNEGLSAVTINVLSRIPLSSRILAGTNDGLFDEGFTASVYLQRIDSNGHALWQQNGVCIAQDVVSPVSVSIASDGQDGALIAWDARSNGLYSDVYAQRVDQAGTPQWSPSGIALCEAEIDQIMPRMIVNSTGETMYVWWDHRKGASNADVYVQKTNAEGGLLWGKRGMAICLKPGNQYFPDIVLHPDGGAYVTWLDMWDGDVWAQRMNWDGAFLWPNDGINLSDSDVYYDYRLAVDRRGNLTAVWTRHAGDSDDIYVQRLDGAGSKPWGAEALLVSGGGFVHRDEPRLVTNEDGESIIAWRSWTGGINVLGIDSLGSSVHGDAVVASPGGGQLQMCSDGSGGAYITWRDAREGNDDIFCQRIGSNMEMLWDSVGIALCSDGAGQEAPQVVLSNSGGPIVAWLDLRNGNYDIYAQRASSNGEIVETLLQEFSTEASGSSVAIRWTIAEIEKELEFFIRRAETRNGPFIELRSFSSTGNDRSFTFFDENVEPGSCYWYRIEYSDGIEIKTLFETGPIIPPAQRLVLHQNSPNPFNPTTEIRYFLPERTRVSLRVYDIKGALITSLAEGVLDKGNHAVTWDGLDENGCKVGSGVYLYRLEAGKASASRKMLLLR